MPDSDFDKVKKSLRPYFANYYYFSAKFLIEKFISGSYFWFFKNFLLKILIPSERQNVASKSSKVAAIAPEMGMTLTQRPP